MLVWYGELVWFDLVRTLVLLVGRFVSTRFMRSGLAWSDLFGGKLWTRTGLDRVVPGCSAATVFGLSPFSLLTVDRKPARPVFAFRHRFVVVRCRSVLLRFVSMYFVSFRSVLFFSVPFRCVSVPLGPVRFGSVGSWCFGLCCYVSLRFVMFRSGSFRFFVALAGLCVSIFSPYDMI